MNELSHVLMTADTVGGVWTYSIELARSFSRLGIRTSLATMGGPLSSSQSKDACRVEGLEVHESSYKLEWMEQSWQDIRAAGDWLLNLEGQLRPDLVHLNQFAFGSLSWAAPCIVVAHSCVLSWWKAVRREPAPPEWDAYRALVRKGLLGADLRIGVSRFTSREIEQRYGLLGGIETIYNGCDTAAVIPVPKQNLVFSCGRLWDEAKNVEALDRVAPNLSWPVYVAGDDQHPEGDRLILRHAQGLGRLSPDQTSHWYSAASIYCLPARYEPFGLSALEAARSGCALVLGDIPSLREIWHDAALFVSPDDDQVLVRTLNQLIADSDARNELAFKARQRALTFSTEKMTDSYLRAYGSAQSRHQARERELSCAL
jgi:glycosyltransferase involved in cell wall biosynthesis